MIKTQYKRWLFGEKLAAGVVLTPEEEARGRQALEEASRDNEERKTLWRGLAAYELNPRYEEFAEWLHLDAPLQETRDLFDRFRVTFVVAWRTLGPTELGRMCRIGWNGLYHHGNRLGPEPAPERVPNGDVVPPPTRPTSQAGSGCVLLVAVVLGLLLVGSVLLLPATHGGVA